VVHFDAFMRHYLTAKTGEIPNVRDVYVAFKNFTRSQGDNTRALVADIHAYATYYCALALDTENDPALKQAFHDLRELKVDVAYPFLLDVYHDYQQTILSASEVLQIVRLVESYVFRRAICAIPTNSLNTIFAGLSRTLKKETYLESTKAAFLLLPSYRRFPKDDEFQRELKGRDLYNFGKRTYWLRRLENHGRNELVHLGNCTIEHILPQSGVLSEAWRNELGPDWKRVQDTWLHTLGNLTLTGYNGQYSDREFAYKRDQVKDGNGNLVGFAHSPLRLNQGLGQVQVWNEEAIKARASRLANEATTVWLAPQLVASVFEHYRPTSDQLGQVPGLGDHPHLVSGLMSELFKTLRQSILALDACVKEEFLKSYVAYKAETNFVDIVPQARSLVLVLNLSFGDIDDPDGLCRDISNIGSRGNGDVEIRLSTQAELPYVIGLIRQSFDRQMGGEI
jgi:predicted transport protein